MVATDTGIYWKILEDTGKVNILEKHTGKQVFWTNKLEIYWKKVLTISNSTALQEVDFKNFLQPW